MTRYEQFMLTVGLVSITAGLALISLAPVR